MKRDEKSLSLSFMFKFIDQPAWKFEKVTLGRNEWEGEESTNEKDPLDLPHKERTSEEGH